jgi:High potential iron-sulfur protein
MAHDTRSQYPHRRRFLAQAAALLGGSGIAFRSSAGACVDPNGSDSSLRQSLHYVATSPDPTKRCSACSFFSEQSGQCGKCVIFSGSTDANGHCDSWAARS